MSTTLPHCPTASETAPTTSIPVAGMSIDDLLRRHVELKIKPESTASSLAKIVDAGLYAAGRVHLVSGHRRRMHPVSADRGHVFGHGRESADQSQ